ncbi:hypothetical protein CMQ_1641 [Grosmannia clavigera kw1407]|uniref:JmjC domain-containing protein n=1 Tax=Grosmannia clavigera (strain kw1407 / UAMH 11150) TaxID=655863 RepID=F0XDX0_GROCL|nr:uncharacterized protein CMQ_1641 [Grosmannia clavigera kw1407]EFX04713.1 hypothetical protein CMQ_1641 [Grosmannia clavigera kw1407]
MLSRRYSGSSSNVSQVPAVNLSTHDLDAFRRSAFLPERPLLIRAGNGVGRHVSNDRGGEFAATSRWFVSETAAATVTLSPYLEQFSMAFFPYEIMCPPRCAEPLDNHSEAGSRDALESFSSWLDSNPCNSGLRQGLAELVRHHLLRGGKTSRAEQRLVQLHAPLALLIEALKYNREALAGTPTTRPSSMPLLTQLYIAQASLSDLPTELRDDVPTPHLVRHGGRGDIYDTSLWLGLEPTYTPWHRDPNPNLFCQLCSSKTVRLAPPAAGEPIFRQVQTELARSVTSTAATAHSRIRGEEMMQGPERRPLHDAIWTEAHATVAMTSIQEAHVEPGDMLFIPKGWWHSVKSAYADGRLNASVNWWFR